MVLLPQMEVLLRLLGVLRSKLALEVLVAVFEGQVELHLLRLGLE